MMGRRKCLRSAVACCRGKSRGLRERAWAASWNGHPKLELARETPSYSVDASQDTQFVRCLLQAAHFEV